MTAYVSYRDSNWMVLWIRLNEDVWIGIDERGDVSTLSLSSQDNEHMRGTFDDEGNWSDNGFVRVR